MEAANGERNLQTLVHPSFPQVFVEDIQQAELHETEIHVVYQGETAPSSVQQKALFDLSFSSDALVDKVNTLSESVELISCQSKDDALILKSNFKTPLNLQEKDSPTISKSSDISFYILEFKRNNESIHKLMEFAEKEQLFDVDTSISSIIHQKSPIDFDNDPRYSTVLTNNDLFGNHSNSLLLKAADIPSSRNIVEKERKKEKRGRSFSMPANAELELSPEISPVHSDDSHSTCSSNSNPYLSSGRSDNIGRERQRVIKQPPGLSASSFRNLSDSWRKGDSTGEWYKVIHSEFNVDDDDETNELFPVILRTQFKPVTLNLPAAPASTLPSPNFNVLGVGENTIARAGVLSPFKEDETKNASNFAAYKRDSLGFSS